MKISLFTLRRVVGPPAAFCACCGTTTTSIGTCSLHLALLSVVINHLCCFSFFQYRSHFFSIEFNRITRNKLGLFKVVSLLKQKFLFQSKLKKKISYLKGKHIFPYFRIKLVQSFISSFLVSHRWP